MKTVAAVLFFSLLCSCAYVKVPLPGGVEALEEYVVEGQGRAKVAIVDLSGIFCLAPCGSGRFKKEPPIHARLHEELGLAMRDPDIVGLVARIDSSGGSVTASDIIYHELKTFRERKGVPLIACIFDKGLSGGYYVALAADEIVAHPTAVVGGVGVISFKFNVEGLLDKWGIENESVKSGELKDFWSPLRQSKPEEVAIMQGITDRMHKRFLGMVQKSRELIPCVLEEVSKGNIFDAQPACDLGLVDRVGYLEDAIARVKELAGVKEARVIIYRRPGAYAESIYAFDNPLLRQLSQIERAAGELLAPSFRYQFVP